MATDEKSIGGSEWRDGKRHQWQHYTKAGVVLTGGRVYSPMGFLPFWTTILRMKVWSFIFLSTGQDEL
jgi:hypothetical protein